MEKDLKRFSLQFFAEQDNEDEVVDNQTDDETSEDEDEVEEETFQDDEETADDVEDEVEEGSESHTEGKKKQTKQANEYFKKLRLSQKKNDDSKNLTYEQGRINGILEAVNHVNPFTNEKIEDDEDIQEFLIMREMKDKGLDPVEDYSKYLKGLAREKRAEQSKKQSETDFVNNDIRTFSQKYPDKKIDDVMKNKEFVDFASASIGKVPLADLYESYERFMSTRQNAQAQKVAEEVNKSKARSKASSGALGTSSQPNKVDYSKMSDSEFEKMLKKAKLGQLSKNFK